MIILEENLVDKIIKCIKTYSFVMNFVSKVKKTS